MNFIGKWDELATNDSSYPDENMYHYLHFQVGDVMYFTEVLSGHPQRHIVCKSVLNSYDLFTIKLPS